MLRSTSCRISLLIISTLISLLPFTLTLAQPSQPTSPPSSLATPRPPLTLSQLTAPLSEIPLPTAGRTFQCENWGFYRQTIPMGFVADGVCDCCDGSDERVKAGQNPFFPAVAAKKDDEKAAEPSVGGWLSGLFGASEEELAAQTPSPCPNTCPTAAANFLRDFEAKVESYAQGVALKTNMLKGVPAVNKRLTAELAVNQPQFEAAVEQWKLAKAAFDENQNQETHQHLQNAQRYADMGQFVTEHLRWLLSQPVPDFRNRAVQRQPGFFGSQREWLLLYDRCFEYAWPQRRFGHFGEHVDWYLMELCPLHNATQVALVTPPKREGPHWRDEQADNSETDPSASQFAVDSPTQSKSKESVEPPTKYTLGHWTMELMSAAAQAEQKQAAEAAANAAALEAANAAAAAAASADGTKKPPIKRGPTQPYKPLNSKSSSSSSSKRAAPGSVLSTDVPEPSYVTSLRNGQECWQVGPRQADVQMRCGQREEIIEVRENGKCKYEFIFETPIACDKEYLAILQKQLQDYKSWFNREQVKPKPPPTLQQLLHDEL